VFYGATFARERACHFCARAPRMRTRRTPSRWPCSRWRSLAPSSVLFDEIARCRSCRTPSVARARTLSMLVAARYDDGSGLGDEALRDHLMTLLIGATRHRHVAVLALPARSAPHHDKMRVECRAAMPTLDATKSAAQLAARGNESDAALSDRLGLPRQLSRDGIARGSAAPLISALDLPPAARRACGRARIPPSASSAQGSCNLFPSARRVALLGARSRYEMRVCWRASSRRRLERRRRRRCGAHAGSPCAVRGMPVRVIRRGRRAAG